MFYSITVVVPLQLDVRYLSLSKQAYTKETVPRLNQQAKAPRMWKVYTKEIANLSP
jgi:hypothetical protein